MTATIVQLRPASKGPVQRRPKNAELRARPYVLEREVERLCAAAKKRGRHGLRDALMITLAYRSGLRVSELISLEWSQLDLEAGRFHVRRLKGSIDSVHALDGDVIRALRTMRRGQPTGYKFVWRSEKGAPPTRKGFSRMLERTAVAAGLDFKVHPHALRHGCGFVLANDQVPLLQIAHHLGHAQISNTTIYARLAPNSVARRRWARTV
jgi:integrase